MANLFQGMLQTSRTFILQKTEPQNVSTTGVIVVTVLHVHASTLSIKPSTPLETVAESGKTLLSDKDCAAQEEG